MGKYGLERKLEIKNYDEGQHHDTHYTITFRGEEAQWNIRDSAKIIFAKHYYMVIDLHALRSYFPSLHLFPCKTLTLDYARTSGWVPRCNVPAQHLGNAACPPTHLHMCLRWMKHHFTRYHPEMYREATVTLSSRCSYWDTQRLEASERQGLFVLWPPVEERGRTIEPFHVYNTEFRVFKELVPKFSEREQNP